jgi:hypothetical protein
MIRCAVILCLMLSLVDSINAVPTTVQGNAFSYRGKWLEIHEYTDLFTFSSQKLDSVKLPDHGTFKLSIDIDQTGLYFVKIGRIHAHVFMIPGDEYTIVIPEPIEMDRFSPAKNVFVQPEIFEANSRLNYHITSLEADVNEFFIENTQEDFKLRSGSKIRVLADTFITQLNEKYAEVENAFFQDYLHFKLAELSLATRHSKAFVFQNYFNGKTPAYSQLTYANTFSMLYDGLLEPHSLSAYSDTAADAIITADVHRLNDLLLQNESTISNDETSEMVIAIELHRLRSTGIYDHKTILRCYDSLMSISTNPQVKTILRNSTSKMLKLAPGTKAPNFVFADVVGNLYRISEYEGGFIYIQFFKNFDSETLRQMSLMKVLKEGYGADIAMFSFSTEESLLRLSQIPKKHDFDWFFGKIGSPQKVIDSYDLRAMPQYFFLDESLNIVQNPTPPPGGEIERKFAKIWNERHPNKMMPFKLQPPQIPEDSIDQN